MSADADLVVISAVLTVGRVPGRDPERYALAALAELADRFDLDVHQPTAEHTPGPNPYADKDETVTTTPDDWAIDADGRLYHRGEHIGTIEHHAERDTDSPHYGKGRQYVARGVNVDDDTDRMLYRSSIASSMAQDLSPERYAAIVAGAPR